MIDYPIIPSHPRGGKSPRLKPIFFSSMLILLALLFVVLSSNLYKPFLVLFASMARKKVTAEKETAAKEQAATEAEQCEDVIEAPAVRGDKCISSNVSVVNDNGAVKFPCPSCGKYTIVRCSNCRKIVTKYKCPVCGFEGPN